MTRDRAIARHEITLAPLRRPAVRLVPGGGTGWSVFGGGKALLPPGIDWPTYRGPDAWKPGPDGSEPLFLHAQVDLAEVRAAAPECAPDLPAGGVLQVFVTEEVPVLPWAPELGPDANPRVHLWPARTPLREVAGPQKTDPARLRFEPYATFADLDGTDLEEDDEEAYDALTEDDEDDPLHLMLGVATPVQEPPPEDREDALILQLASDDRFDWWFYDRGTLAFHADLRAWREGRLERLRFRCDSY